MILNSIFIPSVRASMKIHIFFLAFKCCFLLFVESSQAEVSQQKDWIPKQHEQAAPSNQAAIKQEKKEDSLHNALLVKFNKALFNFNQGNIANAVEYSLKLKGYARDNANLDYEIKALKLLSEIHASQNNYKKALRYRQEADSILNNTVNLDISQHWASNAAFNTAYNKLQEEKTAQEKKLKFNQLAVVLSVLLISILSLFTLALYKNNRLRAGVNNLLKTKNNELLAAKMKAEKANEVKDQFLSTITHELRTPIYAINGFAYLLKQENPRPEQLEHIKALNYSGEHLLSLVNNILDLNKLAAGKVTKTESFFEVKSVMEELTYSFKNAAEANAVTLHLEIDEKVPSKLFGDILKLKQILINLLSNAIKFTENGEVWLSITCLNLETNRSKIRFSIRDTGRGIKKEFQQKIFDNFHQGESSTSSNYRGTGLGLPIVKSLLEFFDSEINLESTFGEGSTFYFDIVFHQPKEEKDKNQIQVALDDPRSMDEFFKGKKVLIAEDNIINLKLTNKILLRRGFETDLVKNGLEAINKAVEKDYDLILMDINMPILDGIQATIEIKSHKPKLPIIALTAVSLDESSEKYIKQGFVAVIPKPYKTEMFYQKIYEVLLRSQA